MEKKCPIEFTLSLISGKWKILILKELSQNPLRYGTLGKSIPKISPKMLIQHLREMGKSFSSILVELRRWGLESDGKGITECKLCKKCQPHISGY